MYFRDFHFTVISLNSENSQCVPVPVIRRKTFDANGFHDLRSVYDQASTHHSRTSAVESVLLSCRSIFSSLPRQDDDRGGAVTFL
jgi:hypothetical protein